MRLRGRYLTTPIFGGRRAASEEISVLQAKKEHVDKGTVLSVWSKTYHSAFLLTTQTYAHDSFPWREVKVQKKVKRERERERERENEFYTT